MLEESSDELDLLKFLQSLPAETQEHISAVLNTLISELMETDMKNDDVLFCGSNGKRVVKCMHYDRKLLGGVDGPVIFPSANPMVVIGAYSNEFIENKAAEFRTSYADSEDCEEQWHLFLNGLADDVAYKAEVLPAPEFEDLLAP